MMLPPSATEPLDRRLPSENHPENVDVIVGVKALLGNFREGAKAEYPGVVDQNVQSSERGIHFLEQARDFRGLGHVGPDCDRIASAVRDRLSNPFGASPVGGIVHGHLRARSCQGGRNPTAYAFGCARHDCHFIGQSAHNSPSNSYRLSNGRLRYRLPVKRNNAFTTAGEMTGTGGSPHPEGVPVLGTM